MAAALVSSSSSPSPWPTAVQDAATVAPPSPFLPSFSAIDFGRHLPCSPPLPTVAVLPFLHCHRLRLFLFILRRFRRPPRSSPNAADEARIFGTDHHRSSLPFLLRPALASFLIFSVAATRLPETRRLPLFLLLLLRQNKISTSSPISFLTLPSTSTRSASASSLPLLLLRCCRRSLVLRRPPPPSPLTAVTSSAVDLLFSSVFPFLRLPTPSSILSAAAGVRRPPRSLPLISFAAASRLRPPLLLP